MGCIRSKNHSGTKEDPAVANNHSSNEPKTGNVVPGEIFLPYADHEAGQVNKDVDFNVKLELVNAASAEAQDQHVFKDVDPEGLAYSAGFREGDVLRDVNGDSIEGSGIDHVLDLLRNYGEPEIFLGVKRDSQPLMYIWVIFEIVKKDGVPVVQVNQTLENDTDELPLIAVKKYFEFRRKSVNKYDIYVDEENKQFYLTIEKEELVFQTPYEVGKSSFHKYYYTGNPPGKGLVVVYSLDNLEPHEDPKPGPPSDAATTPASEDKLKLMDMPDEMVEWGKPIPSTNHRFWFEKKIEQPGPDGSVGASVVLQSVNATPKKYLGIGDKPELPVRSAVMTEKEMVLTVAQSNN